MFEFRCFLLVAAACVFRFSPVMAYCYIQCGPFKPLLSDECRANPCLGTTEGIDYCCSTNAAIVIAEILGILLIIGAIAYCCCRKKRSTEAYQYQGVPYTFIPQGQVQPTQQYSKNPSIPQGQVQPTQQYSNNPSINFA